MKAALISKLTLIICILCLITGFFSIDRLKPYDEKDGKSGKNIISNVNKAAVLEMEGAIASSYESGFFSSESNASALLRNLAAIQNDNEIKGVIIKLNTPGGTVAMSQNIYNKIMKLRETKPVIVLVDDVAASGGYYIASAADRIVAQEGSLTGSIGVIFSFMDYHNLLSDTLKINPVVIKSGKYKDIGSSTREMSEEEKQLMQDIVNDSYNQFVTAILNGRVKRNDNYGVKAAKLTPENLKAYADGRVFTGKFALAKGFVDANGDIDTAKTMIEQMMREKFGNKLNVKLVNYTKKTSFNDYISGLSEYNSKSDIKLSDIVPMSLKYKGKLLYLWE